MRILGLAEQTDRTAHRALWAAILLAGVLGGCASVPDVGQFLFATNADRDNADALADADGTSANDTASAELGLDSDVAPDADAAPDVTADADSAATDALADGDSAPGTDAGDVGSDADAVVDADADATPSCASLGTCSDGNACTVDSCVTGTGCVHTALDVTAACSDNDACTADSCTAAVGCVHTALDVTAACSDNDACTVDSCTAAVGCVHTAVSCDDQSVCTTDSCLAASGCSHVAIACDDGKPCTGDSCDATKGCISIALSGTPCDDEDACTSGDTCQAGTCVGQPIVCGTASACVVHSCNSATGCVTTFPAGTPCDDGDACTSDDSCASGACAGLQRLWHLTVASDQDVLAIAARPDGGFVTVSRTNKLVAIRAWAKDGTAAWSTTVTSSPGRAGIAVAANGDVGFAGNSGADGLINLYTSSGALIASTVVPSGSSGEFDAILADATSGFHAFGHVLGASGDPGDAWFCDVDAAGKVVSQTTAGGPSLDALYAATVTSDGNYVVGGVASQSLTSGAFLFKTLPGVANPNKNALWSYNYPSVGTGRFNQIAPASDGGVLAIGEVDTAGAGQLSVLMLRLDANGKVLWSHVDAVKGPKNSGAGVAKLPGDRWLAGYNEGSVSLNALATDGTPLWAHTLTGLSAPKLVALQDGTIGFAGGSASGVQVQRIDQFGNGDCTTSGGCLTQTFADCSDANVCTSDECTGGSCAHPDDFFGNSCSDGDVCHAGGKCDSGSCLGAGDLLGFVSDNGFGEGTAIAALPDDGWVILTTTPSAPPAVTAAAYASTGKARWSKSYSGLTSASLFVDATGNTILTGFNSLAGGLWLRRIDLTGTETASWSISLPNITMLTIGGGMAALSGGYMILGSDGVDGALIYVSSDGQLNGQQKLPGMAQAHRPVLAADGGFFVSASTLNSGSWSPFVAKFSQWGNSVWRYDYPTSGAGYVGSFSDPAPLPGGGCAVALASDTPHILRFSADGTLVRTDSFQATANATTGAPAALAATADGSLLLTTVIGASSEAWRIDPQGNLAGNLVLPALPGPGNPVSVAVSAGDHVAFTSGFAASPGSGLGPVLGFWRADPFLNGTCKGSGACAGKLASDCGSSNSCILDGCSASLCVHTTRDNGSACTDGTACTWADACAGTTCVGGKPVLGAFPGNAVLAAAVLAWGDNSATVSSTGSSSVVAEKRDPTGTLLWSVQSPVGKEVAQSRALIDLAGNLVIPGHDDANNAAWLWQIDPTGAVVGDKNGLIFGANQYSEFRALVATQTGYYAIGTTGYVAGSNANFWLVPMNFAWATTGTDWKLGSTDGSGNANNDVAASGALASDGGVFLIGTSTPAVGLAANARLVKFNPAAGMTSWQYTNNSAAGSSGLDVVATADGGCLAVGSAYGTHSQDLWLARFDAGGAQQWSRTIDDNGGAGTDDYGYGAAAFVDGSFAVVGRTTGARLWRFDSAGAGKGDWPLAATTAARVAISSTGGLLIAANGGTPAQDILFHTDLFGNLTCGASGSCFDYTTQSCDDKNPCTLDVCQGACIHTNVADGQACVDGSSCTVEQFCTAGVCGGGKPALWSTTDPDGDSIATAGGTYVTLVTVSNSANGATARLWDPAGTTVSSFTTANVSAGHGRMQVNGDGSYVVAGATNSATDTDAWIAKFSANQKPVWSATPGVVGSPDRFDAVAPRFQGGYWAVGSHLGVSGAMACWVQGFDEFTGAEGTGVDLGDPTLSNACVNARVANDSSVFVVGTATGGSVGQRAFAGKLNAQGFQQWTGLFVSGGKEAFYDIVPNNTGAIAVGTTGTTGSDVLLVQFDNAGVRSWVRKIDYGGTDEGRAIYLRNNGTLDVAGTCAGAYCLMHLSASGNRQWEATFGTGRALQLLPYSYNSLILTGESTTGSILRVDWSGNGSCTASGGCASNGETGCSSADQCTYSRCTANSCSATTLTDGMACDDGQPCTGGDMCAFGQCVAGTGSSCGDGVCSCGETVASCLIDCQ